MARFQSGVWQGYYIKARPLDVRRYLPFANIWTLPYNNGSKLRFEVEVTKYLNGLENVSLPKIPFRVVWTDPHKVSRITSLDRYASKSKGAIEEYSVPSNGAIEIWVEDPQTGGAINLIKAESFNPSLIFLSVIGGLILNVVLWLFGIQISPNIRRPSYLMGFFFTCFP